MARKLIQKRGDVIASKGPASPVHGGLTVQPGARIISNEYACKQPVTVTALGTNDGTPVALTANDSAVVMNFHGSNNYLIRHMIGANSKPHPVVTSAGLDISGQNASGKGLEICGADGELAGGSGNAGINCFEVGASADVFYFKCRINLGTVANSDVVVGFRKIQAHQNAFADYSDYAVHELDAGVYSVKSELNGTGATDDEITAQNASDSADSVFEVRVNQAGTVTYIVNGTTLVAGTDYAAAYTFDASDVITPFIHQVRTGTCATVIKELEIGYLASA